MQTIPPVTRHSKPMANSGIEPLFLGISATQTIFVDRSFMTEPKVHDETFVQVRELTTWNLGPLANQAYFVLEMIPPIVG